MNKIDFACNASRLSKQQGKAWQGMAWRGEITYVNKKGRKPSRRK